MRVALYARVSTERQEKERTVGTPAPVLTGPGWTVCVTLLPLG
jgi:hypothetical protein